VPFYNACEVCGPNVGASGHAVGMRSVAFVAALLGASGTVWQAVLSLRELGRQRREDVRLLEARDDLRREVRFWRSPFRWRRWRAEVNEAVTDDERDRLKELEGHLASWSLITAGVLVGLLAAVM
jgi:hypothetical protein